jgi:hypothetical protein
MEHISGFFYNVSIHPNLSFFYPEAVEIEPATIRRYKMASVKDWPRSLLLTALG